MKKPRAAAVALSLVLSINMAGCTKTQYKNIELSNSSSTVGITNHCHVTVLDSAKKIIEEAEYLALCDNIKPTYNCEEYYITEEEIDTIISNASIVATCDNKDDDVLSLINQIDSNTESYIKDKGNLLNAFHIGDAYEELDEEKFRTMIYEAITESLYDRNDINLEYYCKLKDIKIVIERGNVDVNLFGYFNPTINDSNYHINDKDTLVLCLDNIIKYYQEYLLKYEKYSELYDNPYDIYYFIKEYILKHELNHVNQVACNCRLEKGQTYLDVRTLSLETPDRIDFPGKFLMEASAESNLYLNDYDYKHDSSYIYPDLRDKEALILLLSLYSFNDIEEYYDAIEDSNLPKLYDFLGINTKNDFYDFYKVLYQIDSIYGYSSFLDNFIREGDNFTCEKAMEFIGDAAYTDLYKLFIKNAIECTNKNSKLTLEDNLFLYELGRSIILGSSYKITEVGYKYYWNDDRIKEFENLDDIYKSYLTTHYETSFENLKQLETKTIESVSTISYNTNLERKITNEYPILKTIFFTMGVNGNIFSEYEKAVDEIDNAYTYSLS